MLAIDICTVATFAMSRNVYLPLYPSALIPSMSIAADFLHCFAMKSGPLPFIIHRAVAEGKLYILLIICVFVCTSYMRTLEDVLARVCIL